MVKKINSQTFKLETIVKNEEFPHAKIKDDPYSINTEIVEVSLYEMLIGYSVKEQSHKLDVSKWHFYYSKAFNHYQDLVEHYVNEGYDSEKDNCVGCDTCKC